MSGWRFLPEGTQLLAPDESVLWQGRPTVSGMARRFLHLRAITGYFGVLAAWNLLSAHADGMRARDAMVASFWVIIPAVGAAALILAVAWVLSATTHYMLTSKRLIMQIGVALPIALSVPLRSIGSADLRLYPDGTGDITLSFGGDDRLAYLLLWPHARPWRYKKAEPMMRTVRNAREVAALLARALVAVSPAPSVAPLPEIAPPVRQAEPAMVVA